MRARVRARGKRDAMRANKNTRAAEIGPSRRVTFSSSTLLFSASKTVGAGRVKDLLCFGTSRVDLTEKRVPRAHATVRLSVGQVLFYIGEKG